MDDGCEECSVCGWSDRPSRSAKRPNISHDDDFDFDFDSDYDSNDQYDDVNLLTTKNIAIFFGAFVIIAAIGFAWVALG